MRNPLLKNPHFLLVGHVGSHNRGCEALVRTTIQVLSEEWPEARFTLPSCYPEQDGPLGMIKSLRIMPGKEWPRPQPPVSLTRRILRRIARKMSHLLGRQADSRPFPSTYFLRDAIQSADLVLSIGGDNYSEYYGPPNYFMELLDHAHALGRKTVIWGATIGPFDTPHIRQRMIPLLNRVSLLTIRDQWTADYLAEIGAKANIVRVADTAFLLEPEQSERTVLPQMKRPLVGFNGSGILYQYIASQQSRSCVSELQKFLQSLIDKDDFSILLVPHDTTPGSHDSDWNFLFWLQSMIERPERTYLLPPGLNARETKACIGQCDAFVGMRMHAVVASMSQAIPTLALSYSHKFVGLMKSTLGHADYLMEYKNIQSAELRDLFGDLWRNREGLRSTLCQRLPGIKQEARAGVRAIRSILEVQ